MSNYSIDPNSCRIDIWKKSGKWYTTEVVVFRDSDYRGCIHKALKNAIDDDFNGLYKGMLITCLEPYHQHSHPISIIY